MLLLLLKLLFCCGYPDFGFCCFSVLLLLLSLLLCVVCCVLCVVVVVVVVCLCCHVVKLGKAKNTPEKVEVLPGIFYKTSYGCMYKSYCFCFRLLCYFSGCSKTL